jgi:hypothetical protein
MIIETPHGFAPEAIVARHLPVQVSLSREARHQIARAPDERNSCPETIISAIDNGLQSPSIEGGHLRLLAA